MIKMFKLIKEDFANVKKMTLPYTQPSNSFLITLVYGQCFFIVFRTGYMEKAYAF